MKRRKKRAASPKKRRAAPKRRRRARKTNPAPARRRRARRAAPRKAATRRRRRRHNPTRVANPRRRARRVSHRRTSHRRRSSHRARRRNPSGNVWMDLLKAALVGGSASLAVIAIAPKILPATVMAAPYQRGAAMIAAGLLLGYGGYKLGYPDAGLAVGAMVGGAGVATIGAQFMAQAAPAAATPTTPLGTATNGAQVPQATTNGTWQLGNTYQLGSTYQLGMGAVELGAVELGAVQLGAIEAQLQDDLYY